MQQKSLTMTFAVMYAAAFIAGFNENLMNMALMSIMRDYAIDSVTAQWLVTGYMIMATLVVVCMAYLFRRVPLRPLFFAASGLTLAGSLMGLCAPNFVVLLLARLIQAAGSGAFIPLMMNTILALAPINKLGTYLSIGSCMITFGPALAPVVCGALVTAFGWHSIFAIPAIATLATGALGAIFVGNLETSEARLDGLSVALAAAFLTALSYGLVILTSQPLVGLAALAGATAVAVAFVIRQLKHDHPLIDLEPVKSSAFWPALILVTIAMMSTFSLSVLLPLYFEGACGMSAALAGVIILVPVLCNAGATLVGGRVMDAVGEWPLLPIGFVCIATGFAALSILSPTRSMPAIFAAMLLTYLGVGLIFSPSQTAGLRTLPSRLNPHGVALMSTFVQVAACIGPSLYIGLMSTAQNAAQTAGASAGSAAASGFAVAAAVASAIGLVGAITSFFYARRLRAQRRARHRAS